MTEGFETPPDVAAPLSDTFIARLYHYERFIPEHLSATLRDRRIRCSQAANLNDPWDCRPWFDSDFAYNPTVLREWITWCLMLSPDARTELEGHLDTIQHAVAGNPRILQRIVNNLSSNTCQYLATYWHVYCLTPHDCSTLMWSHYADSHRGICLEFAADNALFARAQRVVYRAEYPVWLPQVHLEDRIEQVLLTKSSDWQYEEEYRPIARKRDAGGNAGEKVLISDDGYLPLPDDALKSVIAGCEANREMIAEIVKRYSPGLPVKRVVRSPDRYSLEIE